MDAGQRSSLRASPKPWGWLLLTFAVAGTAQGQPLPPGRPIALTVHVNRCECVLPTIQPEDKYFLVLGSVSLNAGPYRVSIQTESTNAPASIPRENLIGNEARTSIDNHDTQARPPSVTTSESDYPPAEEPLRSRNFYLFVKDRDFYNSENYVTVPADLQGVGRHCQVYVDRGYGDRARLQPTVDDVLRTFDQEVYPRSCRTLGRAADVDRDGRFTILLTPWLGKLSDGKVSLGGFVRGSDFFRDLAPPFGNRCDMMYLNTDLKPGPTLQTILAHEYTHAVIFSEHVFGSYQTAAPRQDEEGWLNEGMAHVAEDLHGYSWSNLDYRISAFLSAPERYQLVVPDYFGAGLFRSHGHRGAAYLFLRCCCDCYGEDILSRLVRTNLAGTANVEAATHQRFADLFRQWSIALATSGTDLAGTEMTGIRRINLHQPLAGRLLSGPRFRELSLAGDQCNLSLAGTSSAFFCLHSPAQHDSRIVISTEPGAELQVTLIRLPEHTARLSLKIDAEESLKSDARGPKVRLVVTAHDQDITLDQAAWERLVPTANRPEDTSYQPSQERKTLQAWFGDLHVKAGETETSTLITLPPGGDGGESWVFKISATDAAGHHLSAWATR
jgi:hypothetical protein